MNWCLTVFKNSRKTFVIFLLLSLGVNFEANATDISTKWSQLTKEDKLMYVNIGSALYITAWGIANWGYGERSAHTNSEGWFGKDTKSGGADKVGHLYSGYVINHALSSLYSSWGYTHKKATFYGAWSSFGLLSYLEVGDSFSSLYSFSYEDFIMNGLGSYIGYTLNNNPRLAEKIDIRIEYMPSDDNGIDIITDYENSKCLVAIKMEGFKSIQNKYLKYLEFHLGYYTRGFSDINKKNERNIYFALGFNFSKLLQKKFYKKTATFLKYYQIPNTDLQF